MTDSLCVADKLELPLDTVTQTIAILARRGAGKTYAAKVLAEEMIGHGLPIVILDPVGVWWGLRSSADGKHEGLPVTILGGDHGDLPLEAGAGKLVANLVAEEPVAIVIDLSALPSKNQHRQFATDFAERLYTAKASNRAPLHVMIDEADEFAPQRVPSGDQRQLGAFETLVRRGRARGIGVTMITQRPAVLNKNVLTQIECLVVMQITSPQDRKALGEWVSGHAEVGEQARVEESLALLKQGESWWWSPAWLGALQRVKIRKARTFDSSATPKAGERRVEAKVLAPVDLDRLKEGMDRVVKDAEANDPRKLRAQIRELERELARRPTDEVRVEPVEVPVPFVPPAVFELGREVLGYLDDTIGRMQERRAAVQGLVDLFEQQKVGAVRPDLLSPAEGASAPGATSGTDAPVSTGKSMMNDRKVSSAPAVDGVKLGKRERAILTVLAQYPQGRTERQIALLTGYSPKASTIGAGLSALRRAGFVEGRIATDTGLGWLGDYETLPTGRALYDYWLGQLGERERKLLAILVDRYPSSLTLPELADLTGYSATASTIGAGMSRLRGLELADGWRASVDFMEAIGRRP